MKPDELPHIRSSDNEMDERTKTGADILSTILGIGVACIVLSGIAFLLGVASIFK